MWYNGGMKRKWFRSNWLRYLRCGLGLLVAAGFVWAVRILLEDDNWLAISALATLVLAFGAFWAILDNRHGRIVDRKERLLNEIIDWALDTAKSAIARQTREAHELWRTKLNYKFHRTKSKYIAEIAVSHFANLSSFIEDINTELDEALDVTTRCISAMHIEGLLGNDEAQRLRESEEYIARAVENLIVEIAKIKTKNIGRKEENMSKEDEATESNKPTLKDIEKHLTKIEGHVIQIRKNVKAQGIGGFGFTGMAAGMALVATGVQTTGGLVIFIVGFIVTLYSFYLM